MSDAREAESTDTSEHIRNGAATRRDRIAKLEHEREAAIAAGDAARILELDSELSVARLES